MCGLPVEPHFLLSNDRAAPRGWAPPKHTCTLDTIGGFARVRGAAGLRERVEGADGMVAASVPRGSERGGIANIASGCGRSSGGVGRGSGSAGLRRCLEIEPGAGSVADRASSLRSRTGRASASPVVPARLAGYPAALSALRAGTVLADAEHGRVGERAGFSLWNAAPGRDRGVCAVPRARLHRMGADLRRHHRRLPSVHQCGEHNQASGVAALRPRVSPALA